MVNVKEEFKLWSGLNLPDTIANTAAIPLLIGSFTKSVKLAIICYCTVFILLLTTLFLYFTRKKPAVSTVSWLFHKYGTLVVIGVVVLLMILKLLLFFVIPNRFWYLY